MRLKLSFRLPSRLLSLALALLVLGGSNASFARPMPQTPQGARAPFPSARYVPSRDYDTRNISLDLRFDWDKEQAIGTETFSFSPLVKDLRKLELDAAYMTFSSIKLANGTALQYQFDDKNEKLSIALDRAYQPSETVTLMIAYHTNQPSAERRSINGGGGLTWIKPTPEDAKRPRQIWSQGESEYNHYWFACFDHPNDFFTSELTATVEKPPRNRRPPALRAA